MPKHPLLRVSCRGGARCLMMAAVTEQPMEDKIMADTTTTMTPALMDDSPAEIVGQSDRFAHLDLADDLTGKGAGWCSLQAVDDRDRVTLFNAVTTPLKLADQINKQLKIRHIYVEVIQVVSDESGELVNAPRVVLIDDKGVGYQSVSTGIYNATKRLIGLFGDPADWAQPHTVEVQNVSLPGGRHTLTLRVIS